MDRPVPQPASHDANDHRERWLVDALALRRVVVTRSGTQGDALVSRFNDLGASVLHFQALAFAPPQNVALFREAVENIAHYDWLVFTSANAVQAFSDQLMELHGHVQIKLPAVATVGQGTAEAVRALGWVVHYVAARGGGLALATELPVAPHSRILLPRADIASADLPNVLRDRDCVVHEVVAYRTLTNPAVSLSQFADYRSVDAVTFTSPSTVTAFVAAAVAVEWSLAAAQRSGQLLVACIGETTAAAVRRYNLTPNAVAIVQSSEGLVEALARALTNRRVRVGAPTHDLRIF